MVPLVAGRGFDAMPALFTGLLVGALFHAFLGLLVRRIRLALPPLVTGLVIMMIGLSLIRVGIQYAAGGPESIGTPEYGSFLNWSVALLVVLVTLGLKFFGRGMIRVSAVLIGIIVGYGYTILVGILPIGAIAASWESAAAFALPQPYKYGFEFSVAAIMCF